MERLGAEDASIFEAMDLAQRVKHGAQLPESGCVRSVARMWTFAFESATSLVEMAIPLDEKITLFVLDMWGRMGMLNAAWSTFSPERRVTIFHAGLFLSETYDAGLMAQAMQKSRRSIQRRTEPKRFHYGAAAVGGLLALLLIFLLFHK